MLGVVGIGLEGQIKSVLFDELRFERFSFAFRHSFTGYISTRPLFIRIPACISALVHHLSAFPPVYQHSSTIYQDSCPYIGTRSSTIYQDSHLYISTRPLFFRIPARISDELRYERFSYVFRHSYHRKHVSFYF